MTLRSSPTRPKARRPPSWGSAPLPRSRPAGVRFTRGFRPPPPSVLGVSHALDGLLLQQAPGPFQAGAAPGVLPTELCSSSDSRTPLGAVTLLPFLATAVLHSEVFWKITVLRSCRVFLRPRSPYPAGLPPRRQADALLGFRLSRALEDPTRPALPPANPHALRLRRASRKTGRRLCHRGLPFGPSRGSVSGPPALLRFSTWSRPRCPREAPRRFRPGQARPARGGLPPKAAGPEGPAPDSLPGCQRGTSDRRDPGDGSQKHPCPPGVESTRWPGIVKGDSAHNLLCVNGL